VVAETGTNDGTASTSREIGAHACGLDTGCALRAAAGCPGGAQDAGPSARTTHQQCEKEPQAADQPRAAGRLRENLSKRGHGT